MVKSLLVQTTMLPIAAGAGFGAYAPLPKELTMLTVTTLAAGAGSGAGIGSGAGRGSGGGIGYSSSAVGRILRADPDPVNDVGEEGDRFRPSPLQPDNAATAVSTKAIRMRRHIVGLNGCNLNTIANPLYSNKLPVADNYPSRNDLLVT